MSRERGAERVGDFVESLSVAVYLTALADDNEDIAHVIQRVTRLVRVGFTSSQGELEDKKKQTLSAVNVLVQQLLPGVSEENINQFLLRMIDEAAKLYTKHVEGAEMRARDTDLRAKEKNNDVLLGEALQSVENTVRTTLKKLPASIAEFVRQTLTEDDNDVQCDDIFNNVLTATKLVVDKSFTLQYVVNGLQANAGNVFSTWKAMHRGRGDTQIDAPKIRVSVLCPICDRACTQVLTVDAPDIVVPAMAEVEVEEEVWSSAPSSSVSRRHDRRRRSGERRTDAVFDSLRTDDISTKTIRNFTSKHLRACVMQMVAHQLLNSPNDELVAIATHLALKARSVRGQK